MRHVAVVGSGPAGYYTAEALAKQFGQEVQVDIIDCLPTPYGLIRAGVAPDHQSIKAVYKRYEGTSLSGNVRFVGNVLVGRDVQIDELLDMYNAVVLATGAPHDRPLGVEGDDLPGVIRKFGPKISFVHFRDVRGVPTKYEETWHDAGKTDMLACMRAYKDIGFDGVLRPDHVPTVEGDSNEHAGYSAFGRLFAIGYIRGLQQAVYAS